MKGWFVANGEADTPDCLDKFSRSWRISHGTGGSDDAINVSHTHGVEVESVDNHLHGINAYSGGVLGDAISGTEGSDGELSVKSSELAGAHEPSIELYSSGFSGVGKNMPVYINSIPIIRMS